MTKKFNPKRKPNKLPYRKVGECYLFYKGKLIAQDAGHYLSLPGGGIDRGETPEKGAARELMEELGIFPKKLGIDVTTAVAGFCSISAVEDTSALMVVVTEVATIGD